MFLRTILYVSYTHTYMYTHMSTYLHRDLYLHTEALAPAELQQAVPGGSGGRRPAEGPLHVPRPLIESPLDPIGLV